MITKKELEQYLKLNKWSVLYYSTKIKELESFSDLQLFLIDIDKNLNNIFIINDDEFDSIPHSLLYIEYENKNWILKLIFQQYNKMLDSKSFIIPHNFNILNLFSQDIYYKLLDEIHKFFEYQAKESQIKYQLQQSMEEKPSKKCCGGKCKKNKPTFPENEILKCVNSSNLESLTEQDEPNVQMSSLYGTFDNQDISIEQAIQITDDYLANHSFDPT